MLDNSNSAQALALQREIALATKKGVELKGELNNVEVIQQAIYMWNETGLVRLVSIGNDTTNNARWLTFRKNNLGVCEAPCIGMCTRLGELAITCDLEGAFHSNRLQSMLHEIGHVIGLRHEHARKDRAEFVETTNLDEPNTLAVGVYDFNSVMHYGFGDYPGGSL